MNIIIKRESHYKVDAAHRKRTNFSIYRTFHYTEHPLVPRWSLHCGSTVLSYTVRSTTSTTLCEQEVKQVIVSMQRHVCIDPYHLHTILNSSCCAFNWLDSICMGRQRMSPLKQQCTACLHTCQHAHTLVSTCVQVCAVFQRSSQHSPRHRASNQTEALTQAA